MKKSQKITTATFCVVKFFIGSLYSVIASFFPTEASEKGVSTTLIGLIFAAFELTMVFSCPILASFLNQIGAKFMYISGIFVCGVSVILFGVLDHFEDRTTFIVMCFVVRCIKAVGAAAIDTAIFAIVAHTYPDKVATMLGTLETCCALGVTVGAPIGGALYELGGFCLPFVTLGSILFLLGFASIVLLPSSDNVEREPNEESIFSLLRIPIVTVVGAGIVSASMIIGYCEVSLSMFLLDSFHLSPVWVGSVFLVGSATQASMFSVWGYIGDKKVIHISVSLTMSLGAFVYSMISNIHAAPEWNNCIISVGSLIGGLSFCLMGPAPFIHFKSSLWLVYVTMSFMNVGLSAQVISYKVVIEQTIAAGHADCLATYGLIAGYITTLIAIGTSAGCMIGGYLDQQYGFKVTSVVFGSCSMLASFALFVYTVVSSRLGSLHDFGEMENGKFVGNPAVQSNNSQLVQLINDSNESEDSDES